MTYQQTATCQWRPSDPCRNRYIVARWSPQYVSDNNSTWCVAREILPSELPGFASFLPDEVMGYRHERHEAWITEDGRIKCVTDEVVTERPLVEGELLKIDPYPYDPRDWFDLSLACSRWSPENDALEVAVCQNGCGEL